MRRSAVLALLILGVLATGIPAQEDDILWGEAVPENWTGDWPEELRTAAERADFEYTATNQDILEYFAMLRLKSEYVSVFSMFTSDLGRTCPVLVMSKPRVMRAKQARESGKPVIYLQGGIHPGEAEGKEALLLVIRDILLGEKSYLLDNVIIMVCPNFNVDGNETRNVNYMLTPDLTGTRHNAKGYDVNRDMIKLETTNLEGAMRMFNEWDPILLFDTHRMGRTRHAYAIAYTGSNVVTASAEPRDYVKYQMFPKIREGARQNGRIEIFYHCELDEEWPPTEFTHERAYWTTEAKFMASGYALRNRMAILVETPGHEKLERLVYAQYVFTNELLEFCHAHAAEMQEICKRADEEVAKAVEERAASGELTNFVEGKYVSEGKASIFAYHDLEYEQIEGTSVMRPNPEQLNRRPELVPDVDLLIKPVGVKEARVPRGYLIPADMEFIVDKLKMHGVKVDVLDKEITVAGEEFVIDRLRHDVQGFGRYAMTQLDGAFVDSQSRTFPSGTYLVDMAQPLANLVFYCLEPQVNDGFVGWNLLDDYLVSIGAEERSVVYPIFKFFRILGEE